MKLLFASDSFKGTLTSEQTAELLARAAQEVFGEIEFSGVPVADGGEGTTHAVVAAENGQWIEAEVRGPLMEKISASYGRLDEYRAIIEMAAASGLLLVPTDRRNPLKTTSYGTGDLIATRWIRALATSPSPSAAAPPTTAAWVAPGRWACASWMRRAGNWRARRRPGEGRRDRRLHP